MHCNIVITGYLFEHTTSYKVQQMPKKSLSRENEWLKGFHDTSRNYSINSCYKHLIRITYHVILTTNYRVLLNTSLELQ